jgi:hypothetical protein
MSVTLDNASANTKAIETLSPIAGYLGYEPAPTDEDPTHVKYNLLHQRCACHIINLIVKSGFKRMKSYTEDFRTAINFLNSSNQRIAMFKNYCIAKGVRPRKFGLDMDVRWNATYLMLKHLLPYKDVFSVFIYSNYGSTLLTVRHHLLEIITHLTKCEKDTNMFPIVYPMKLKHLKYWKEIPLLYSIAFIIDPRGKMRGLFNVLQIMQLKIDHDYTVYYANVKTEIYKLFNKYEKKFGFARTQRRATQPTGNTSKRKYAWGRIFGGPRASGVVRPSPVSAFNSSLSASAATYELTTYLDSDNVTLYEEDFDLLLW